MGTSMKCEIYRHPVKMGWTWRMRNKKGHLVTEAGVYFAALGECVERARLECSVHPGTLLVNVTDGTIYLQAGQKEPRRVPWFLAALFPR